MSYSQTTDVTDLLLGWADGDQNILDELLPRLYDQLKRLAKLRLGKERGPNQQQPTELVHEAYLRLADQRSMHWRNRGHFFAVAATTMRRILVDKARSHQAAKRDRGKPPLPLIEAAEVTVEKRSDLVALDDCLTALAKTDPQKAQIVELRFFGGLSIEETAAAVGCSRATVIRQWRLTRAWLRCKLHQEDS